MSENNTGVGVSNSHTEAEATIKEFQRGDRWYERPSDVSVLPEDLFNSRASRATVDPETALLCAVLENALDCFQKQFISGTQRAKRLGQEAEEWLFSDVVVMEAWAGIPNKEEKLTVIQIAYSAVRERPELFQKGPIRDSNPSRVSISSNRFKVWGLTPEVT